MREELDLRLLERAFELSDVGDVIDGEPREASAEVGDDEAGRLSVAGNPEHVCEVEDGQHLAVEVAHAEHSASRTGNDGQVLAELGHLEDVLDRDCVGFVADPQADVHAAHRQAAAATPASVLSSSPTSCSTRSLVAARCVCSAASWSAAARIWTIAVAA